MQDDMFLYLQVMYFRALDREFTFQDWVRQLIRRQWKIYVEKKKNSNTV